MMTRGGCVSRESFIPRATALPGFGGSPLLVPTWFDLERANSTSKIYVERGVFWESAMALHIAQVCHVVCRR